MLKTSYKDWESFKFQGKRFLALKQLSGNVHIYGENFANYGVWMAIDNFKKDYKKNGEKICLDVAI